MVITVNAIKTQTLVASKHKMNACSLHLYYAVFTQFMSATWFTLPKTSCDIRRAHYLVNLSYYCKQVLVIGCVGVLVFF
jgi:hypothetical protein